VTSIVFFDKKDIEDLVTVPGRVAVIQVFCLDDPGRHERFWLKNELK
jgi:hypothetical protein